MRRKRSTLKWARTFGAMLLTSPLLLLAASGCQGPDSADSLEKIEETRAPTYLLRLPEGASQMGFLRSTLARRNLAIHHEYGSLVGLSGTVAVHATPDEIRELISEMPMAIEVRRVVYRYPLQMTPSCGDGVCQGDEAATAVRSTTCSYDCGTPSPRESRDELTNAWHARVVGADRVWADTQGEGIHVGVLDTGYDRGPATTHPDRPLNLGAGYNFPAGSPDFSALADHGTHVAGIVGAARNGFGTIGVAPKATIHNYQVFRRSGAGVSAADADIIAAIEMAIRSNLHIINLSLGGGSDSELEHEAMRKAYDAGILAVVAAGNAEDYDAGQVLTAPRHYPGAYPESMSVGATTSSDTIAGFSSTGHTVTVSAPGQAVYSTVPVGTGDIYVKALFDVKGDKVIQLQAAVPEGASLTGIKNEAIAWCGYGKTTDVSACQPVGKVALVRRGPPAPEMPLTFEDKIRNARLGGAVAVLIYNHRAGDAATAGGQFGASLGGAVPVPILTLPAGDGEKLEALLKMGKEIRVTTSSSYSDFAAFSGTSMAAPVVAGVAALVWSKNRHLNNVQLRQLLSETAVDLGAAGRDDAFGFGRVDAVRALARGGPTGRCGDSLLDRASEICDGDLVGQASCDLLGWDAVPGTRVRCNNRCTALDQSGCSCQDKGTRFDVGQSTKENHTQGGQVGTLATYSVKLKGQPVRGAMVHVVVTLNGSFSYDYDLGPSNDKGEIDDFTPYTGTGMTPGTYVFAPVINKGGGRCHPDQATPGNYSVIIKS